MLTYRLFLILSLLFLPIITNAQSNIREKIKLAESYERSGDFTNAARLYKELFDANPKNDEIFQSVIRTYQQLNRYSELRDIIEKRLTLVSDFNTNALYGEVLWQTGNHQEANRIWSETLKKFPPSFELYIAVFQSQSKLRLIDKAVQTLLTGRKALNNPTVFSNELSQLYIATGNYQDGTEEILNFFNEHKHISFAQGRLFAFMNNPKAVEYIKNRLKREASTKSNDVFTQELYAYFLRAIGDLNESLSLVVKIDNLKRAEGREILYFADRSRQDDQLTIALEAYSKIIDQGRNNRYFTAALYGYAKTLERKITTEAKITPELVLSIIDRYSTIARDFKNLPEAANSLYQIAFLYHTYLNQSEKAIDVLNELIKTYRNSNVSYAAMNLMGDIYIYLDKLDNALDSYQKVIIYHPKTTPTSQLEYAEYKIAEIIYFKGSIDSALVLFKKIANNISSDVSNDAIEKIVIIEKNKQFTEALKNFALAELREIQLKSKEAVALYQQIGNEYKGEDLAELSMLRAGKILIKNKDFNLARQLLNQFIEVYPESIYGDLALLHLGNSYMEEGLKELAIQTFTTILSKYPRSIYLQEVRDKIRKLRDEKI